MFAFLPLDQMKDGMTFLDNIPDIEDLEELLNYFDQIYVSGTFRRTQHEGEAVMRIRQIAHMFPPGLGNTMTPPCRWFQN